MGAPIEDLELNDEVDATIVLAPDDRLIGVRGHRRTEALVGEAIRRDSVVAEIVEDGLRSLLRAAQALTQDAAKHAHRRIESVNLRQRA